MGGFAMVAAFIAAAFSCFAIIGLWRAEKSLDKSTRMIKELERRIRDGC